MAISNISRISNPENLTQTTAAVAPAAKSQGGGAPAATSTYSSTDMSKVYDKRDTNKDGVVSYAEQLTWDLKHPEEVKKAQGSAAAAEKNRTNQTSVSGAGEAGPANTSMGIDLFA